jgi:diguanylate cyclase (GGDEF)-like protein/PAS domain S-box-containing protein
MFFLDHRDDVHEELLWAKKRLEIIFEHNAAGIFLVDDNRDIIMVNQRFCDIVGFTKKELIGQNACYAHISQESCKAFGKYFREAKDGLEVKLEYFVRKKGCDGIWAEFFGSKIELDKGRHGVIWSIIDISERKLAEKTINNMAFYDTLTGLTNRRLLEDRLSLMIANKKRNSHYGAVLFLDLDNFKILNDTFGHQAGDAFLIEVASRLLSCVREVDTVSRFGGDEFVVVIDGLAEDKKNAEKEILSCAQIILSKLNEPYQLDLTGNDRPSGTIRHLSSASIGISLFNQNDKKEIVLDRADRAMYLVKGSGKNNIIIYSGQV